MPHQERLPQRKDKVKEKQMLSRHIDFEGMSNVRDLGGMTGADGKKIKSGLLFRSDQLHRATKADQEKLKEIGVKYIVDLRNIREYTEQPDPRIDGITHISMPLNQERMAGIERDTKSREEMRREAIDKASRDPMVFFKEMSGYYAEYANAPYTFEQMHKFFQLLIESDGGVLWHCAGGKDRTGILAVLLCEVLQVSREDIEGDYLATNLYKQKEADAEIAGIQKTLPPDCSPEIAVYMTKYTWLAHIEYLQYFYKIVAEKYGDIHGFLKDAVGLTADEEEQIREKFLK